MTSAPTADPAPPPKSLADRVLGSVPVVLTVLATLLAGTSSGEMTQAQYHRSLAAQYQSKAGDQWNFFQAKRQRGVILIGQLDALRAELAGGGEGDYYQAATRLVEDLQQAASRAGSLPGGMPEQERYGTLKGAATRLSELLNQEAQNTRDLAGQLSKAAPRDAELVAARDERLKDPRPALMNQLAELAPALPAVVDAIDRRRPEAEIAEHLAELRPNHLTQAIERLETLAAELDGETRALVTQLEQVNRLVVEQVGRLQPVFTTTGTLERAMDSLVGQEKAKTDAADLRRGIEDAVRPLRRAAAGATELVRRAQLARNEYNERRYECEARYNQMIAGLYEAQVRKSSQIAEKHRHRSYLFFYAMLVAQAGVTLATFALAVRQMSALWGVASLAGLLAMATGIYVYFFI